MINAFIENMEQINVNTGAKEADAGDETSAGKVLFPKSGFGRPAWWNVDVMVARCPVPGLPDLTPPAPGAPFTPSGGWIPWSPNAPGPGDIPPRRRPEDLDPGFSPPFPPGWFGPGTAITAGDMMSAGYNDPNFGLPADGGGSFMGPSAPTYCIMQEPIMPATPPGGLFGPDAYVPFWGNPPSNATADKSELRSHV